MRAALAARMSGWCVRASLRWAAAAAPASEVSTVGWRSSPGCSPAVADTHQPAEHDAPEDRLLEDDCAQRDDHPRRQCPLDLRVAGDPGTLEARPRGRDRDHERDR